MTAAGDGVRRVAHGYSTAASWGRLAQRAGEIVLEVLGAAPHDAVQLVRGKPKAPLRIETGEDEARSATRIALYVHFSPQGRVSEMVRQQLRLLARAGFAIVFVSMSRDIPPDEWQAVRRICALVVQRENVGRDFGAWKALMPGVRRRWPAAVELLLANDSVLGPVRPIEPVFDVLRSGGDGLFGLTESLQGGPHLQSYMLLARGGRAVDDLVLFLGKVFISRSKWLMVQMTEIRLARWMRQRGHRVAAVFGYDRVVRAVLADPGESRRLLESVPWLRGVDKLPLDDAIAVLHAKPLNPTHHLWHALVVRCGSPFLKTELVMRNPGRLPGVEAWASIVPVDAPCSAAELRNHLRTMGAAKTAL